MSAQAPLLSVSDLTVQFRRGTTSATVVSGFGLTLERGQRLGLVGESGCGKSTVALTLMGLLPPNGQVRAGQIRFQNRELLTLRRRELEGLRGNQLSMVFQNPLTSLDPCYTVGAQIVDVLRAHRGLSRREARQSAIDLLRQVGIPAPEERFSAHPHQLSGGQRQRVVIAIALACNPALLIADEPTTALDVTIQSQILRLLHDLCAEREAALILITHDLGVVAQTCTQVAVMYAGHIVEMGPVEALFARPLHPYTVALLRSMPQRGVERGTLAAIEGTVPDLTNPPTGCPFAPRCARRMPSCDQQMPRRKAVEAAHETACYLYGDDHEQ